MAHPADIFILIMPSKQNQELSSTPEKSGFSIPSYDGPQFMPLYGKEVDIIVAHREAAGIRPEDLPETPEVFEILLSEALMMYKASLLRAAIDGGRRRAIEIVGHQLLRVETDTEMF